MIKREPSEKMIINAIINSFLITKRFKNKDTYDKIYDFIMNNENKNLDIFRNFTNNMIQYLEMLNLLFKTEDKILHEDSKNIIYLTNDAFSIFFSSSLLKTFDLYSIDDYILYYNNYLKTLLILPMIGYKLILAYDKINQQYTARCELISLKNDDLLLILDYKISEQNIGIIPIIYNIGQKLNFNDYVILEDIFSENEEKIYYLNKFLKIDNKKINHDFYIDKIKFIYAKKNLNYNFDEIMLEILTLSSALYILMNAQYDYKELKYKESAFNYLIKKNKKNNVNYDIIINKINFSSLINNHPLEYYNTLMKLCFAEMNIKENKCSILCHNCKIKIEKIITENIIPHFNNDFFSIIDELFLKIKRQ